MTSRLTHAELIAATIRRVRAAGPVAAHTELVADGHHATLATFWVWAIDRLVTAGLSDMQILWHPLTDARSPLAWYPADVLASDAAREHFVPATLALAHEPQPHDLHPLIAA